MRTEWLDKKVPFRVFIEKMIEYVLRKLNNPSYILPLLRENKDPVKVFKEKHITTELSEAYRGSGMLVAIHQQRIKKLVDREMQLESNMCKLYGLIKGQCSHSLRAVLKQENDFEEKDGEQNVLWLMEKLQKITSGLDSKSNKLCNLFDALFAFVTMRQGDNESDTAYMKSFKVNLDTLYSAGGMHILCSPELMEAEDSKNPTKEECEAEEKNLKQ